MQKQVHEENALQKSIIIMQQNSAHFEEGIVRAIQSAWQTYDEWQLRMNSSVQDIWRTLGSHMASLAPDREWIAFSARSDHLLDPETPLRNPETIQYPSKEDPSVVPVHTGYLERKKRFTRTYREAFYVLTPAGYLHEYPTSDPTSKVTPVFSLFLPMCTLGPPSPANGNVKSHKFHIEGKKDGTGALKGLSGSIRIGRNQQAFTFRGRSHDEMMEWWNDIRMLCARYLVASEQMERSGPIAAAVRAAGYVSEEEDEDEVGSSVEEEDDNEIYQNAVDGLEHDGTGPPSYSHPNNDSGYHIASNGYMVRTTYITPILIPLFLTILLQNEKKVDPSLNGEGANLSRRPSKRQQEKAPEGQPPHMREDAGEPSNGGAGPAPQESRFVEVTD